MKTKVNLTMLLALLALLTSATPASAADEASPANDSWYGWEYGAADAAGVGMLVYARANAAGPLVSASWLSERAERRELTFVSKPTTAEGLGAGLYLGGAPITHLVNGHPANAVASLALRLAPLLYVQATSLVGGIGGFFVRDSHGQPSSCTPDAWICLDFEKGTHTNDGITVGADVGLFGGAAAAVLVDQVLFSRESLGSKPKRASFVDGLAPDLRVGNGSAYAGVGGSF